MESQARATGRDESSSQILVDGKPWVWSEVDPLLTPEHQADLLRRILEENEFGPDPCDQGPDPSLHSLDQAVRGMSVQENDKQHARRQVRKNLKPR